MQVWDAIREKRAVRHFQEKPLPDEAMHRILDAGRRSQSSKNSQPWDFIAIRDRETLQKLSTMGNFLGHVAGAALCVAIVTPVPGERFAWHMFDTGQAASYMQLAALEIGVGSCLGTVYQPDAARELLGFPEDKLITIVISFGYPADEARQGLGKAGRRDFEDVIHWDRW
ncbi:MAG: nitroreductase family protein [Anaerolineaceae bacterium]|nr:nitroreductase family protein [Anaerolineaceae bacterium]